MDLGLKGKVAIVTGASKGIGAAIAAELAREGAKLILAARSADKLAALSQSLGPDCIGLACDLREAEAPAKLAAEARARFGRIDILVNNAGATKRGDFLELTDADWADGFALKFQGAMRLIRAAWPDLVQSQGSVVNIVGVGGRTGSADFTIGGSVNAAILNLTKSLADRGIREGVRVNAINPGWIATERMKPRVAAFASQHGITEAEALKRLPATLGVSRVGEPLDIARAVAFLVAPQSSYIQGAILDVDGGMTRTL